MPNMYGLLSSLPQRPRAQHPDRHGRFWFKITPLARVYTRQERGHQRASESFPGSGDTPCL